MCLNFCIFVIFIVIIIIIFFKKILFKPSPQTEIGNAGLSEAEARTHFALWCLIKSPLLIGADIRSIKSPFLDILKNKDLIAINQDPLGVQGHKVAATAGNDVLELTPRVQQRLMKQRKHVLDWQQRQQQQQQQQQERHSEMQLKKEGGGAGSALQITLCSYSSSSSGSGSPVPLAQQWVLINSRSMLQEQQTRLCMAAISTTNITLQPCDTASPQQKWVVGSVDTTLSQLISAESKSGSGACLATDSRGGLFLEDCQTEPAECKLTRCANSVLVTQLWYLSAQSQLISSFTNTTVPPLDVESGLINQPLCAASLPNSAPPVPPIPVPHFDPTLTHQVHGSLRHTVFVLFLH